MANLKFYLSAWISHRGFRAFIFSLPNAAKLLDVGCGNNSPYRVKRQRPDLYYVGLDVGDYNQTMPLLADEYVVVPAEKFVESIAKHAGTLDAAISSHNIEHCDDPAAVICALAVALKPGGTLYMSFPSEQSVRFPSRGGCLNFYDDSTHRRVPGFDAIQRGLRQAGLELEYARQRYRPLLPWIVGALMEPISRLRGHIFPGTWALYGFETVIWAKKA